MRFRFSPEDEAFRAEVREFIRTELPKSRQGGESFTKKLAAKGWLTMSWPKEYGGQDAGHIKQLIYNEEMSYNRAPGTTMGVDRVGPTIILFGTEEQKAEFLPRIARDEITWCQGFSEPGAGSDLASLQTRAVQDGDDFIVNGSKIWTSNAQNADYMILLTRTDPDAPKHRGISYFLLDMKTPGITIRPLVQMTGQAGFNQVFFDNVRVPARNMIGEKNRGWYVSTATLDFERSGIRRVVDGLRTFEEAVAYAKRTPAHLPRRATPPTTDHHRPTTLFDVPHIRHALADIAVGFEVGRLLCYRVAWMQSQQMIPNYEASMAKVFGTELQQRLARVAINMMGLHGQLRGPGAPVNGGISQYYLSSVSLTIAAGTSEVNRNIIAQRGLGLPRD
ncbi:MAG TPA: acyl-CoA dehydrogenase family protein [Dehalococcoidia bacterium]|nr:acyl-CoA dehydrogenase family protein [Dehalococcoidia bacterium]